MPVELCYKGVMLHRLSLTAIILFITVTASSAKEPPTVAEVLAQVVKAYGGEKKLRSINGYHANGEQWAAISNQTIEAERWFGRGAGIPGFVERADRYKPPATDADLEQLAISNRPIILAIVGGIGLLVIVWLMVIKPF